MNEEIWVSEMATKLSGIIFRKALIENNWSGVYEKTLQFMMNNTFENEMNLLEILGGVGG